MLKMFKKRKMLKMYTSTCSALSGISQGSQGSGLFQTAQGGPGGLPRAQQPTPASPGPCGHAQPSPAIPSCPGDQGVCPVCRGKPGHVQAMWRAMLPMTVTSHPGLSEGLGSLLCCLGDCEVRPQSLSPWVGQKLNFSLEENWRKVYSGALQKHFTNIFAELRIYSLKFHGRSERKSAILDFNWYFLSAILLFQFYTLF